MIGEAMPAARLAALGLALAGAYACSRSAPPDAALPTKDEWRVECRPVKDDLHQACFGPGWEAGRAREPGRFHFYQVSVERKQASDAPHVLFVKRLDIAAVEAKALQDGGAAVQYDAPSRMVRFEIAREPVVFALEAAR